MRKIILATFIGLVSVGLLYGVAYAAVSGPCVNCHTMHASQDGTSMLFSSDVDGNPNEALTRAGCIGCHGQGTASNIVTNIPQVLHTAGTDLAGGNFAYITGAKTPTTGNQNTVGHNVIDLGTTYQETTLTSPPGDEFNTGITNANFTCGGTKGCHGDRTIEGSFAAISGAHHAGETGQLTVADTVANSYRFLKGVHGYEDADWQATASSSDHNEYKGDTTYTEGTSASAPAGNTISGLCAECHGNFHGTETGSASPWLRHPTDTDVLPKVVNMPLTTQIMETYTALRPRLPESPLVLLQVNRLHQERV